MLRVAESLTPGEVHGHDDPIRGAASRPGRTAAGVGRAPPASERCPVARICSAFRVLAKKRVRVRAICPSANRRMPPWRWMLSA